MKVPYFGPHAGQLVRDDGTPVPDRDTSQQPPPVAVPQVLGRGESYTRETISLMQGQLVEAGWSPEHARAIAVSGALRADGVDTQYPDRAAERRPTGER